MIATDSDAMVGDYNARELCSDGECNVVVMERVTRCCGTTVMELVLLHL